MRAKGRRPLLRGCLTALLLVAGYVLAMICFAFLLTLPAGTGAQSVLMDAVGLRAVQGKSNGAEREAVVLSREEFSPLCVVWVFELPEAMAAQIPTAEGEHIGDGKWRMGPLADAERRELLERLGFPEAALQGPADPEAVYESRYRMTMMRSHVDETVIGHFLAFFDAETRRLLVYDLRTSIL